LLAYLSC